MTVSRHWHGVRPAEVTGPTPTGPPFGPSESEARQGQRATCERLKKQHRSHVAKLDRVYDGHRKSRISEDFWTRKSARWEEERRTLEADIARVLRNNSRRHAFHLIVNVQSTNSRSCDDTVPRRETVTGQIHASRRVGSSGSPGPREECGRSRLS